jgi:hypothetical protein
MAINRPQLPSCTKEKDPFIKLGGGQAPVLNYNLPQRTSFTTYGDNTLPIDDAWFKAATRDLPVEVRQIDELPIEAIKQKISDDYIYPNLGKPAYVQLLDGLDLYNIKRKIVADQPPAPDLTPAPAFQVREDVFIDDGGGIGGGGATGGGIGGSGTPVPLKVIQTLSAENKYIDYLANLIKVKNMAAIAMPKFGDFGSEVMFVPRPPQATPTLYIIEEYKTSSFLGDYGAGETVNTFSLLPGEKHNITIRTFKEKASTASRSDNVMDSFSQSSAAEFENLLQEEKQTSNSSSATQGKKSGGEIGLKLKWLSLGGNKSKESSSTATRSSNTSSISKALQKHTDSTNSSRQVSVNTTTSDSQRESFEEGTVREIVNPNLSRVLNFVFRQLLQEYVSITYLNDIKVAYNNGHPESFKVVGIEELDDLLNEVIEPTHHEAIRQMIRNEYQTIENYKGDRQVFIEEKTVPDWDGKTQKRFFKKRSEVKGNYTYLGADGQRQLTVEGPILNVDLNTLRTDSLVTDALLGQGEALDCFNSHAQEAKTQALYIENANKELLNTRQEIENAKIAQEKERIKMAMETLSQISDLVKRAELIAAIFNPQVQNIIH